MYATNFLFICKLEVVNVSVSHQRLDTEPAVPVVVENLRDRQILQRTWDGLQSLDVASFTLLESQSPPEQLNQF